MKKLPLVVVLAAFGSLLSGCVTHIKTTVTQNPPPAEKFSAFTHFDLQHVRLAPQFAGQAPNERALVKIQQNVSLRMDNAITAWNAAGANVSPVRTLVIEPEISDIKFISVGSRIGAGALAGSSAVILRARITEKETGRVIATPEFFAWANAWAGAFSVGATDNVMLIRIATRFSDYLLANYAAAVGGPTGAEPEKK